MSLSIKVPWNLREIISMLPFYLPAINNNAILNPLAENYSPDRKYKYVTTHTVKSLNLK
jgi:hypothetical protein